MKKLGYCTLTDKQESTLLSWVKDEVVHDLGAGNLSLALLMSSHAKEVHAIDKELPKASNLPANVHLHEGLFNAVKLPTTLDCVVLAWPPNMHCPGLLDMVKRAFRVAYIGSNTSGSACGTSDLFVHLSKRMLVHEVRHHINCLHCYSAVCHQDPQFRSEEEVCGMLNNDLFGVISYGKLGCKDLQKTVNKHPWP